jgi:DNA-binding SARP family transcriptional activator
MRRTEPWPRPNAEAAYGQATVFIADGRLSDAIETLQAARANSSYLGSLHALINARLIEALYLAGRQSEIAVISEDMANRAPDPRFFEETAAARAIALHVSSERCGGECLELRTEAEEAAAHGAALTAIWGRLKLGSLALQHGGRRNSDWAWQAAAGAAETNLWTPLRVWLRKFAPYSPSALKVPEGGNLLALIAAHDPDGWRGALVPALSAARGNDRAILLAAIQRVANRHTVAALEGVPGLDVAAVRRELRVMQAPRLFMRTLGAVQLHRAAWDGPLIPIEKKRARMLLAVLAAHAGSTLSRDIALEILWPDSDPDLAVNSLNQTVFQLRRFIDPTFRVGESPEYIFSTADAIGLNPDLVLTDVAEIRRLPARLSSADWRQRQTLASRAATLVQGEFLSDFRYEDWVNRQQLAVHGEIRDRLLAVAQSPSTSFEVGVSAQAAGALINLDPYDESAVIALADCLAQTGRRAAAKQVLVAFAKRLESDLEMAPSQDFADATSRMGPINPQLT